MIKATKYIFYTTLVVSLFKLISCSNDPPQNNQLFSENKNTLSSEEILRIQNGDIIMRQGYGIVSSIILRTLKEDIPVSHIGIINQDSIGEFFVIHSVSRTISEYDGMQIDKLDTFIDQSRPGSVIITRYINNSNITYNPGQKISQRAQHYLNIKTPFDHNFNLADSTAFFCSELVWRIISDLFDDDVFDGYSTDNMIEKLKFSPFLDPERFEIIVSQHDEKMSLVYKVSYQ